MFFRMPFGITSGSDVFQRAIEMSFDGYPSAIIVDDLLVWGKGTADLISYPDLTLSLEM